MNPLLFIRRLLGLDADKFQRITGQEILEALREATKDQPIVIEIRFPGAKEGQ